LNHDNKSTHLEISKRDMRRIFFSKNYRFLDHILNVKIKPF